MMAIGDQHIQNVFSVTLTLCACAEYIGSYVILFTLSLTKLTQYSDVFV